MDHFHELNCSVCKKVVTVKYHDYFEPRATFTCIECRIAQRRAEIDALWQDIPFKTLTPCGLYYCKYTDGVTVAEYGLEISKASAGLSGLYKVLPYPLPDPEEIENSALSQIALSKIGLSGFYSAIPQQFTIATSDTPAIFNPKEAFDDK